MLTLLFTLACSGSEPPASKDVVLTTPKHATPKSSDFQDKSFKCCDSPEANDLLAKYLALTTAMAADDDAKTKVAVLELQSYTQSEAFKTLSTKDNLKELSDAAQFWTTLNRKDIQQDFAEASQTVIQFAKDHKSDTGTTVITAFCPMAPGRWLQTESTISNPYYGSAMLTCGVFE